MFKILVAEDDPSTNRLFCAILRRAGYEPVPVFDGREALEKLDEVQVDQMCIRDRRKCMNPLWRLPFIFRMKVLNIFI